MSLGYPHRSSNATVQAALERARSEVIERPWVSDPTLAQLVDDQLALTPDDRLEQLAVAAEFFGSAAPAR